MNKKELYELCKTLQDDLHKEKLFNDEIVELKQENEELKMRIINSEDESRS